MFVGVITNVIVATVNVFQDLLWGEGATAIVRKGKQPLEIGLILKKSGKTHYSFIFLLSNGCLSSRLAASIKDAPNNFLRITER